MNKFDYIYWDMFDGCFYGSNDKEEMEDNVSYCEDFAVLRTSDMKWICCGKPNKIKSLDDEEEDSEC